ncbi:MAG: FixH family protein, partial [Acidobacteria bacterium]|nr:FixH family protein [Acidobacteriota bacterium]
IVDHSRVWVNVDIYENEIPLVKLDQPAMLTLHSYPGEVFRGRVTYIWPHLDHMTRTLKVRLEFDNPDLRLKPKMYGDVELNFPLGRKLAIPESSLLDTGKRQLVFLDRGQGYFEPREVKVGRKAGGYYEVVEGLEPADRVLTSATFFIDSESQLQAALGGLQLSSVVTEVGRGTPGAATAQIEFASSPSPPRFGKNELVVRLSDQSGNPITDAEVTVAFFMPAMPAMGMGAMQERAALSHTGNGEYRGQLDLPMGGTWQVTVTAQRRGQVLASKKLSVVAE